MYLEIIKWFLIVFGVITFLPLIYAQILVLFNTDSRKTKDVVIGKKEEWRDVTHRKSALAFAYADYMTLFPLFIAGSIGVFLDQTWGHCLWIASGFISIYFSILCWVLEKEYVYKTYSALFYYTFYWGFFLYWGIFAITFSFYSISI